MAAENARNKMELAGKTIAPGHLERVSIPIGRLPTGTVIDIPVYVYSSGQPGPCLLVQAGLHGDEINGVEVVRRMMGQGYFQVEHGTVLAVPVLNIYGFIHFSRDLPDGKDVNRSFPGSARGSLARRIAWHYREQVMQHMDYAIDLHTGGAQRHNHPQIRYSPGDDRGMELARAFQAPVYFESSLIKGSFRQVAAKMGKTAIVFEAGESKRFDEQAIREGIQGTLRLMKHLDMIQTVPALYAEGYPSVHLARRRWIRAPMAGMFVPEVLNGAQVHKGQELALVTDTYGKRKKRIKAPFDGHIICTNHQGVVNQGDALFHIGRIAED